MENNNSDSPCPENNKLDAETRIEMHLEAVRLINEGSSHREAAQKLKEEYGDDAPQFQHMGRILKRYDGTRESLRDLRGTKNGKKVQFSVEDPAMQMILGHKAAGQGSWASGRESVFENRQQHGIPAAQIPTMNQVYYAVEKTPAVLQPGYQIKLASHYNTDRTTAALRKYRPGQLLAADEGIFCYEFEDSKTGQIVKKSVFIAVDAGSGAFRKPYIVNGDFDTASFIKGIKTVLGAAPELGIHYPIAPEVMKLDNATVHRALSITESMHAFQKALGLPFRISFSLRRVPKSNPFAERGVGIVRQMFAEPFLHWMELRKHLIHDNRISSQLFDELLMQFISEHNDKCRTGEKYSRIIMMNMHTQPERMRFNVDLIDQHFRVYREVFLPDEGIKLDWETTLDAVDLLEYRFRPAKKARPGAKPSKKQKPIIIAINPDRIDLLTPAFFKKSKRAPLVYIGDLTHVEADPGFTNRKHKFKAETHAKVVDASALLAASHVLAREKDPKLKEVAEKIVATWKDEEQGKNPARRPLLPAAPPPSLRPPSRPSLPSPPTISLPTAPDSRMRTGPPTGSPNRRSPNMSPSKLTPDRIAVPWFNEGFELARHCVARSAFGYVSAPGGRGKTRLGGFIAAKWLKDEMPGAFHILPSLESKIELVARDAFRAITGQELPKPRLTPHEISNLILEHLAKLEAACLYVDGPPQLDCTVFGFHLGLLNAAQDRRVRLGLVFTTQQPPFTLWGIEQDPNFCKALSLRKLRTNEVVDVYAKWIPEFKPVKESFYKKDPVARQIATLLYEETRGNFQRMVSLWQLASDYGFEDLLCPKRICSLMGRSFTEAQTLTLTS